METRRKRGKRIGNTVETPTARKLRCCAPHRTTRHCRACSTRRRPSSSPPASLVFSEVCVFWSVLLLLPSSDLAAGYPTHGRLLQRLFSIVMDLSGSGSGSSSGTGSGSVGSSNEVENAPLWKYVTKLGKCADTGGSWRFQCNFCNEIKQGSYSRVRAHLLQISKQGIAVCKKVQPNDVHRMKKVEEEAENNRNSTFKNVPLPCGSESQMQPPSSTRLSNKRKSSSPLEKAFDMETRNQLDQEIARLFFTGGLPFNLARNPHYIKAFTFAASHNLSGYVPPGYNRLRTTLLQQEKANVERLLQPLKATWPEKGVTIVTDGWSDPQRRPIINFMATCGTGPMFIKAVNCMGEVKTKEFIANLMKEVIDEIGDQNMVQIIMDNVANCKGVGQIIEGIYPHIYWTPCVVHTLNLALKNICDARNTENNAEVYDECHWITEVHGDAIFVKNFIMNHTMRLSMYNKFTSLKLLSVADTRFASIIMMLKRFKLIRRGLEALVLSEEWASYREDDQGKARFVREKVLSDNWWDQISYILNFTEPIYGMIRVCDTDKPCLHLVYEMWDSMIEKVKIAIYKHEDKSLDAYSAFYQIVHKILVARWTKNSTPLHCLSHSLNPRFYSDVWLHEDATRVPPHQDGEISQERMKCFRRLYPNEDDYDKILDEYASFSLKTGPFSDINALSKMCNTDPKKWWANFGAQTKLLQSLAFRVLGQPTSSSCCERNWSTYSFVHSLRRNKLAPKRAEDLVFVHNNLRLLSRNSDQYKDEKTKMWDVGGDEFGNLDDLGYLEFANLSLDEPELESVIFSE
ncbi:hypothetical protein RJT34_11327 [Clitoria ternatea]|uniref:BED-type domain-containing protein n=1 Tax=Clitoria ternatea TaxID=43366 RepID=A0AAN9PJK3_CLITE